MPSSVLDNKIPHSILFPHDPFHSLPPKVFGSTYFVHNFSPGDENQIKEAFISGGRGHPPSHLKFFLLVFSKLKEDIK